MCTRDLVGVKYVNGDEKKYLRNEDIATMSDRITSHLADLKQKYYDVDLDSIIKTILDYSRLGYKLETKVIPGNILEVVQSESIEDITYDQALTFKNLLSYLSDPKLRNMYNDIFPELGDKLYKMFFNMGLNERYPGGCFTNNNSNLEIDPSLYQTCDNQIMLHVVRLYIKSVFVMFDIPEKDLSECLKEFELGKFDIGDVSETLDFYNLLKFLKEEIVPIANSSNCETYKNHFAFIPNGDKFFELFLGLIKSGAVDRYDCEDLVALLGFYN